MAKAYATRERDIHTATAAAVPLERPLATHRPDYKQTNMPKVLITIVLLAALATLLVGAVFFFNLTDFI